MRPKRVIALLAVAAATAAVLSSTPPASRAAATGALRICTGCAASGGDLSRFDYVILHAWEHGRIAALKAQNPAIKVLVYKNMAATYEYMVHNGRDDALLPAGVGYAWARQHRPEWFLRDTQGSTIEFADYPELWQMDVGDPAYQEHWLASVGFELRTHGWDGVVIDDANVSSRFHTGDRVVAKYPTDAAYTAATRSFLARVGPSLLAEGHLVLPNIFAEWPSAPAVFRDWLQFGSGAVLEYWTKWGQGSSQHFGEREWHYRQQFLPIVQEAGKIFIGITYAPADDVRSMRYARASFLLDWNGGPSAMIFEPQGPVARQPYSSEWTIDIGRPAGPREQAGSVLRRSYTGGLALANSSESESQEVDLGRPYVTPDGARVTSVRLAPETGLVLRAAERTLSSQPAAPTVERHDVARLTERLRAKSKRRS